MKTPPLSILAALLFFVAIVGFTAGFVAGHESVDVPEVEPLHMENADAMIAYQRGLIDGANAERAKLAAKDR